MGNAFFESLIRLERLAGLSSLLAFESFIRFERSIGPRQLLDSRNADLVILSSTTPT